MFKLEREKAGLTQAELAGKLGVDNQFISNIERGICPLPPKHFKVLSRMLDIPVEKFIDYNVERYVARMKKQIGLK